MNASTHVAIVGAGPYALSIAAHLRKRDIDFRIFGSPLRSWREQMPKGMFLKSEGFASNLYDPDGSLTLGKFCAESGYNYSDLDHPVPLQTFVAYGSAFQKRLVPTLEEKTVVGLQQLPEGFRLLLDSGETCTAAHVVLAVGLNDFRQYPAEIAGLPPEVVSHSGDHHDMSAFKGRDVTVLGGGSSALDVVASLRAEGAHSRLVARRAALRWNMPVKPSGWPRWYPMSGLGGGWRNTFFEHAPMMFRHLPHDTRVYIVQRWLGPAGGWSARNYVEQCPVLLGQTLKGAEYRGGRVRLSLVNPEGKSKTVTTDHVIAATGYRVDMTRLKFLSDGIRARLKTAENAPILSRNFESSIDGLHFVGLASAYTFGPVMRFMLGARYTSRKLTDHFASV